MNTHLFQNLPLPCPNSAIKHDARRRHSFGAFRLAACAVDQFNELLAVVARGNTALDCDQLMTVARKLSAGRFSAGQPACVRQRLHRARAALAMCRDEGWGVNDKVATTVTLVARYINGRDDLIPDELPVIGRLDDAILVDAAWPELQGEVYGYLDFRRLRLLAVGRDAERSSAFDRDAWRQAQYDEARLEAHWRGMRERHYAAPTASHFHVR